MRAPHAEQRHLALERPHPVFPDAELEDARLLQPPVARQPDFPEPAFPPLLLEDPRRAGHLAPGGRTPLPHPRRRLGARRGSGFRDGPDEAVAVPRQGLDEARMVRRILEHLAQPRDRGVQGVVEIDEDVVRPEPAPRLVARDDFAGAFDERGQDLEALLAQRDFRPTLQELPGREIDYVAVEPDDGGHWCRL
jgi:hypothetical protein